MKSVVLCNGLLFTARKKSNNSFQTAVMIGNCTQQQEGPFNPKKMGLDLIETVSFCSFISCFFCLTPIPKKPKYIRANTLLEFALQLVSVFPQYMFQLRELGFYESPFLKINLVKSAKKEQKQHQNTYASSHTQPKTKFVSKLQPQYVQRCPSIQKFISISPIFRVVEIKQIAKTITGCPISKRTHKKPASFKILIVGSRRNSPYLFYGYAGFLRFFF